MPVVSQTHYGNFVFHADYDFMAYCSLLNSMLMVEAYYHGVQAIEKYLKALAYTIYDPTGTLTIKELVRWIRKTFSHDLIKLANFCASSFSFLSDPIVVGHLERFKEFDQACRYPYVDRTLGNGFISTDAKVIFDLIKNIRTSLPIQKDDYPLGITIRGHFYDDPAAVINNYMINANKSAIDSVRGNFPDMDDLVFWK
jgi:hypothetical protein